MSLPIFLKWAGGKAQSLSRIDPHIPTEMSNYYEPFLGGGSVLIHVLSSLKSGTRTLLPGGEIIAADINAALINVYKVVQCDPEALIEELQGLADRAINSPSFEEYYYALRYLYNENKAEFNLVPRNVNVETAAYFIYLNHNGFRGLYRENKSGDFNVPYGHYKNPIIPQASTIMDASALFSEFNVIFKCQNVSELLEDRAPFHLRDTIFLDPPYEKLTATTFIAYYAGGADYNFGGLCDWLRTEGRVCHAIFTNHANADLLERFNDFPVCQTFSARRAIHAARPDSRADELLVCSQPQP